jgi:hypothetical protein
MTTIQHKMSILSGTRHLRGFTTKPISQAEIVYVRSDATGKAHRNVKINSGQKFTPGNGASFLETYEFETRRKSKSMGNVTVDGLRLQLLPSYVADCMKAREIFFYLEENEIAIWQDSRSYLIQACVVFFH